MARIPAPPTLAQCYFQCPTLTTFQPTPASAIPLATGPQPCVILRCQGTLVVRIKLTAHLRSFMARDGFLMTDRYYGCAPSDSPDSIQASPRRTTPELLLSVLYQHAYGRADKILQSPLAHPSGACCLRQPTAMPSVASSSPSS